MITRPGLLRALFKSALAVTSIVGLVAGPAPRASAQDIKGYPSVKVVDIKTGKTVDLASNNGGKLPTLAWFWAPH
jgi:hypothetical protein